jgi:hypothetical protein
LVLSLLAGEGTLQVVHHTTFSEIHSKWKRYISIPILNKQLYIVAYLLKARTVKPAGTAVVRQ